MKKIKTKRVLLSLLGNVLLGIAVGILLIPEKGTDPYTSFILGLKQLLPSWSIGMLFLVSNVALLIFGLIFCRALIGIATVANVVLVGFISDGVLALGQRWLGEITYFPIQLLFVLLGTVLLSFGSAIYFSSDLGVSPYDMPSRVLQDKLHNNYRYDRIFTDFICLLFCFICGGKLSWGSVIAVLCIGPLIQFFTTHVTNRWLGYPFTKIEYKEKIKTN